MAAVNVAIAPDLGIGAQVFVNVWNAGEEGRVIGFAGVATNVSELIKKALENKRAGTRVEVREITSPDSSRLLVVTTLAE